MWRKETLADKLSLQVKQSAKKKVYTSTILTDILPLPHSPECTFLSFLPVLQASTSRLHSFGYVLPSDPQTGRHEKIKFISSIRRLMFFLLYRQKDIDKIIEGMTDITSSINSRVRLWKINHSGPGCSFYEFYEWHIFQ